MASMISLFTCHSPERTRRRGPAWPAPRRKPCVPSPERLLVLEGVRPAHLGVRDVHVAVREGQPQGHVTGIDKRTGKRPAATGRARLDPDPPPDGAAEVV